MSGDLKCQRCKTDIVPTSLRYDGFITHAEFAPGHPVGYYDIIDEDGYEDEVMYIFCSDACLRAFEVANLK